MLSLPWAGIFRHVHRNGANEEIEHQEGSKRGVWRLLGTLVGEDFSALLDLLLLSRARGHGFPVGKKVFPDSPDFHIRVRFWAKRAKNVAPILEQFPRLLKLNCRCLHQSL